MVYQSLFGVYRSLLDLVNPVKPMKTVSTKLENSDFKRFQDMCNDDGTCASEALREMIKRDLEAHEEYLEMEKRSRPEGNPSPTVEIQDEKPR